LDTTRRQILQALGVTIASTPLVPFVPGSESVAEAQTCVLAASETIGPYPNHSTFLRQDIREGRPGLALQLLAEGATGSFFDLELLLANPNLVEAPAAGRRGPTPPPHGCRNAAAAARCSQGRSASGRQFRMTENLSGAVSDGLELNSSALSGAMA
jgi:hypothetical protein